MKVLFAVSVIEAEDEELLGRGRLVQAAMAATYPGVRPKKYFRFSKKLCLAACTRRPPAAADADVTGLCRF